MQVQVHVPSADGSDSSVGGLIALRPVGRISTSLLCSVLPKVIRTYAYLNLRTVTFFPPRRHRQRWVGGMQTPLWVRGQQQSRASAECRRECECLFGLGKPRLHMGKAQERLERHGMGKEATGYLNWLPPRHLVKLPGGYVRSRLLPQKGTKKIARD